MTTDNHSATYLNNNPLVYQHYRDWTPQGTRSYNGKLIHYSPPKDVLAQAEVIRGNPGSTSNNFFGVESI
jgi:hypothetical protein